VIASLANRGGAFDSVRLVMALSAHLDITVTQSGWKQSAVKAGKPAPRREHRNAKNRAEEVKPQPRDLVGQAHWKQHLGDVMEPVAGPVSRGRIPPT
jgi:hypothetical protein